MLEYRRITERRLQGSRRLTCIDKGQRVRLRIVGLKDDRLSHLELRRDKGKSDPATIRETCKPLA